MLKNKFKIIALLTVIILTLMVPIVRAENETAGETTENEIVAINEDAGEEDPANSTGTTDDNFKKGDVYLAGDEVTIDYVVDGNLFVFANKVTINSQIGGDAFIFAKSVTISEQGYIFSNLFTFAQDVTISGVVYDLYTAAQKVDITGYIYRDIRVGTNTLNINGVVGRNAFVEANNINFAQSNNEEAGITSQGIINGDFNYTTSQEISIPEGSVSGNVNYTKAEESNTVSIQSYIMSLGRFLATVVILWLLCLWLAPKFLHNTNNLIPKKLLPIVAYGILTPIAIIIAFVILLLLGITVNIALLALGLLFLILAISSSIFVISINNLVCSKLKIEKSIGKFGMLIVSSAILWLINLIPYVGSLVAFVASIIGLGTVMISIIPHKETSTETK